MRVWKMMLGLLCLGLLPRIAWADAHCFCRISKDDLNGKKTATGVIVDLGAIARYTGINQQGAANQAKCVSACSSKCNSSYPKATVASIACSKGFAAGSYVRAWAAVGTKAYQQATVYGNLIKQGSNCSF